MTREGGLFLNGQPTTEEALAARVKTERQKKADVQAIISADQEVTHGKVIRIIDLVKLNGVSRFAINIDPEMAKSAGGGRPVPVDGGP
jgi:biopolymer transport protein ExbD